MTTTQEINQLVTQAQKQAIASLKQAQDLSIKATEVAVGLIPGNGTFSKNDLPKPTEVVESSFGFAGQVLEAQKGYAMRLAEIWTGAAEKAGKTVQHASK